MAEILAERAEAIRVEPPGREGEGVEFWLQRGDTREYHQAKRQHPRGHWTLNDLAAESVLRHFYEKLNDPRAECLFVSSQDALELRELADRARGAASAEELRAEFLKPEKQARWLDHICESWGNCSYGQAYEALKRIKVQPIGEEMVNSHVGTLLGSLVEADPATVADVLRQHALDKVNVELAALDLWRYLEGRGFRRREWHKDPRVIAAVDEATGRYLRVLRDGAIGGHVISRDETRVVVEILTSGGRDCDAIVVGEAGGGKSGVLLQVLEELQRRGWPAVAMRADRLEPVAHPGYVGEQLGLPGSPARVLGAIAQGRECLLVVDQLDAVSLASGRHTGFFDCINEILFEAQAYPAMRILLACRKFDLENDSRLKRLTGPNGLAKAVEVGRLSKTSVEETVRRLGLDPARLSPVQWELLSLPLHLSLLAEVVGAGGGSGFDFETARDLYDRFWDRKQDVLRERLNRSVEWTRVIDTMCDYMSSLQVLSVPVQVVDDVGGDARAMASEHVLAQDGSRYGFFHEGFFDYAFARRFVARGGDLGGLLHADEQHLFRRAQVRQILLHEREGDRGRYLADVRWLLADRGVRFHLKAVVFALLAELKDPTREEWSILEPLIEEAPSSTNRTALLEKAALRTGLRLLGRWTFGVGGLRKRLVGLLVRSARHEHAWNVLYRSGAWFSLLDSLGVIERWLRDPRTEHVDRTVALLMRMQRAHADRIAELLEPYADMPEWRRRLAFLMQWGELGVGRRFLELFLRLIDNGTLDEVRGPIAVNSDFWSLIFPLAERRPEWACAVVGHYFGHRLELSLSAGEKNPFDREKGTIKDTQFARDIFPRSARGAPAAFLAEVLPFMLRVMELTADRMGEPPWPDPVWQYRFFGGGYGTADGLLTAMAAALEELARNGPGEFRRVADRLRNTNFETAQYLLMRGYAANGQPVADEAVDYLCELPRRLEIGYLNSSRWVARELIAAVTPHCSEDRLRRLEAMLLGYYPERERRKGGHRAHGHAQLVLLDGIAASRLSDRMTRRVAELRRKFGPEAVEPPQHQEMAAFIGPPIPETAAEKMTDAQWLGAIARYSQDRETLRAGELRGGALELSRLFEAQVKKQPARFAELVQRFSDNTHHYYFDAVLQGIVAADLDPETLLHVCRRCHSLPGRPCGRWITRLLANVAAHSLPEEALGIVAWYATEDPNPEREEWRTEAPGGKPYYGGDIHAAGINSVRGTAAETIAELIHRDGGRLAFFGPVLERLVRDPSSAVRCCAAAALTAVLRYDRDLAVYLFRLLCEIDEDRLLATHYVERFLGYALRTHFGELVPIVKRMVASSVAEVATTGARRLCVAALVLEGAIPLVRRCLRGRAALRLGAGQVFSANLREASFRSPCEDALARLFNDRDKKVREEVATCFHQLEEADLASYTELIEKCARSRAFGDRPHHLIQILVESTGPLPEVTCLVCERFVEVFGREATTIQTSASGEATRVSQLLVRIYNQSTAPLLKSRCLDLIDRMEAVGVLGLNEALVLYER